GSRAHPGGTGALLAAGGRVQATEDGAPQDGAPQDGAPQDGAPQDGAPQDGARQAGTIDRADLIIDGLLGIGGRGGLREPFAGLAAQAEQARQAGATVGGGDPPGGI